MVNTNMDFECGIFCESSLVTKDDHGQYFANSQAYPARCLHWSPKMTMVNTLSDITALLAVMSSLVTKDDHGQYIDEGITKAQCLSSLVTKDDHGQYELDIWLLTIYCVFIGHQR